MLFRSVILLVLLLYSNLILNNVDIINVQLCAKYILMFYFEFANLFAAKIFTNSHPNINIQNCQPRRAILSTRGAILNDMFWFFSNVTPILNNSKFFDKIKDQCIPTKLSFYFSSLSFTKWLRNMKIYIEQSNPE